MGADLQEPSPPTRSADSASSMFSGILLNPQLTLLPTHPRLSLAKWPEPKWSLGNPSLLGNLLSPAPDEQTSLPLPKRQDECLLCRRVLMADCQQIVLKWRISDAYMRHSICFPTNGRTWRDRRVDFQKSRRLHCWSLVFARSVKKSETQLKRPS